MKFYFSPGSSSLASHIALSEAGLQFETIKVDLKTKTCGDGDFMQINPKGYVPALCLDTGQVMTEGVAIMQWAADQAPDKNLLPPWGKPDRYKAIEWLNYIATELHRGFKPLWQPTTTEDVRSKTKALLLDRFRYIETHLGQNEFLMGSPFTVADGYLFNMLQWAAFHKIELADLKNLIRLYEAVKNRPAVQKALNVESH